MTMLTMEVAKATGVAGDQFVSPKGVTGTILAEKSAHGKKQASMTCNAPNCSETHIRESSDWHQSQFCATHNKTPKGKKGAKAAKVNPNVCTLDDGTVLTLQVITESDDAETKALKSACNEIFEAAKAEQARAAAAKLANAEKDALKALLAKAGVEAPEVVAPVVAEPEIAAEV
jgi:hypothetical protein